MMIDDEMMMHTAPLHLILFCCTDRIDWLPCRGCPGLTFFKINFYLHASCFAVRTILRHMLASIYHTVDSDSVQSCHEYFDKPV
jgi:hypothetical protein